MQRVTSRVGNGYIPGIPYLWLAQVCGYGDARDAAVGILSFGRWRKEADLFFHGILRVKLEHELAA